QTAVGTEDSREIPATGDSVNCTVTIQPALPRSKWQIVVESRVENVSPIRLCGPVINIGIEAAGDYREIVLNVSDLVQCLCQRIVEIKLQAVPQPAAECGKHGVVV